MIRLLRWVRRHVGLVAELAAYGFWLLVDLVVAVVAGPFGTLVAAVGVPARRAAAQAARRPAGADGAAAIGLSLAISVLCIGHRSLCSPERRR